VSVPKILTLFIPEILSHPAIAGRDVRNVKASRNRDSVEGRSPQDRSGAINALMAELLEDHIRNHLPRNSKSSEEAAEDVIEIVQTYLK